MRIIKSIKLFSLLILAYIVILYIIYSLPNFNLQSNFLEFEKTYEIEGLHGSYIYHNHYNMEYKVALDNVTDKRMLERTLPDHPNESTFYQIFSMNNYARYWHGYQIVLRPLLSFFSYDTIRYILSFCVFSLLVYTSLIVRKVFNTKTMFFYVGAWCMCSIQIVPVSLQFSNMTILSMVFMIFTHRECFIKNKESSNQYFYNLFLIYGSLVCFFDFLTTPIMALGLPLIIFLKYLIDKKKNIYVFISTIFCWFIGYIMTWISKLVISSLVLKENIILNGYNSFVLRTSNNIGTEHFTVFQTLKINIYLLLAPIYKNISIILVSALIISIIIICIYSFIKKKIGLIFAYIIIFLLPYAWYSLTINHSYMHAFFTYRSQVVSVMAIFIFFNEFFIMFKKAKKV